MDSYRLWVGIGCNRDTPHLLIAAAVRHVFVAYGLAETAIAAICTIDHKVSELGLVKFCLDRQLPLLGFSAEALRAVVVPNPSAIASDTVGTASVAEAAAILAYQECTCHTHTKAISTVQHFSADCHLPRPPIAPTVLSKPTPILVPKQIFRLSNQPGTVTLAIAGDSQVFSGLVQDLKV